MTSQSSSSHAWKNANDQNKIDLIKVMKEQENEESILESDLELAIRLSLAEQQHQQCQKIDEDELFAQKLQEELLGNIAMENDTDLALAMQLQEEEESRVQGNSEIINRGMKITVEDHITFSTQGDGITTPERILYTADDAEALQDEISQAQALYEKDEAGTERNSRPWPMRNKNLKGQGGDEEILTKHDGKIAGVRNNEKANLVLPARAQTGDLTSRLSNAVFNDLHSRIRKQKHISKGLGGNTVERDSLQTHGKGLDQRTRLILFGMINTEYLDQVHGAIRRGKEATVFHGIGRLKTQQDPNSKHDNHGELLEDEEEVLEPRDVAIKVFKTTLTEFKNRMDYINGDHRFESISNLSHQNPRRVVLAWTEKEMKNLSRLRKHSIPCPEPLKLSSNVLIMEFIGQDGLAAPQLRESNLSERRVEECYVQCILLIQAMLAKCSLVHADFSEYNILYYNHKCYVIDLGQAVLIEHPRAGEFLFKDITAITRFLVLKGLLAPIPVNDLMSLLLDGVDISIPELKITNFSDLGDYDNITSQAITDYAATLGPWVSMSFAEKFAHLRAKYLATQQDGSVSIADIPLED